MLITLFLEVICAFAFSSAVNTLTSNPVSTNGVVTVCPGVPLSFTCSHDNVVDSVTRWEVNGPNLSCRDVALHITVDDRACGPFTITNISDETGPELNSTAQLVAVSEILDGAMVECFDGTSSGAKSVGVITIQVVDPTPSNDSVTYFVDSSVSGRLTINVTSPGVYGTGVTYSGSVVGGSGSVQVMDGNVLSVTGLDYTQNHTVNVNGVSGMCSELERSSLFSYTFNRAELTISRLTPSIQCSTPSLPVTLTWDIDQGTLFSTDPAVPLHPPMMGTPRISYTSAVDGDRGSFNSTSPFTLPSPTVGDDYNFTVFVTNVVQVATQTTSLFRVSAFSVNTSTVAIQGCLTFTVSEDCAESVSLGDFAILLSYGVGQCQSVTEFLNPTNMTKTINSSAGVCIPVETMSIVELCYSANLLYQSMAIMSQTNLDFRKCAVSNLGTKLGSGVTFILSRAPDISGTVPHTTIATLDCGSTMMFSGDSQALCVDSVWTVETNSCSKPAVWVTIVIIICVAVFSFAIGIIMGILLTFVCGIFIHGLQQRKGCTLLLVILLAFVFGFGIGVLIGYCCVKNKKEKDDKEHLESQEIHPPPADSLYADPKSIDHEAAPGTEDQYAMVDRKVKKNTKPKPTPPEALYQDPNTIEHETAASGDTYAVVDKPKRSSKKKGGPDVVPPASEGVSEGLTYADIDLSSKRPKPGSGRQAPQQPGEYPKEHPVEYSSVDHGNTSQL